MTRKLAALVAAFFLAYGGTNARQAKLKAASLQTMHANAEIVFDSETPDTYAYGEGAVDPLNAISYVNTEYPYSLTADTPSIDLSKLGSTTVTYSLTTTDSYGQMDTKTFSKVFTVKDTEAPVITLKEDAISLVKGSDYDPASNIASVTDNADQNVQHTLDGAVDTNTDGIYTITVEATDSSGNTAEKFFVVTVSDDQNTADKVQTAVSAAMQNSVSAPDSASIVSAAKQTAQESTRQAAQLEAQEAAEQAAREAAEAAAQKAAEEAAARAALGSAGRIDCNGYGAKLYYSDLFSGIQSVIDAPDSAAYDSNYGYFADHASQGFNAVFSVGSVMRWTHADGSVSYLTCQAVKYETGNTSWNADDGTNCLVHAGYAFVTQTCVGNGLMFAFWN